MFQLLFSNVTPWLACHCRLHQIADRLSLWVEYGRVVSARGSSVVDCFCWGIIAGRSGCHKTCHAAAALASSQHSMTKLALSAIGNQDARCCVGTRMQDAVSCADVHLLRDEELLSLRCWVLFRCPSDLTLRMPKTVTSTGRTSCTTPERCLKASLMATLRELGAAGISILRYGAQSAPSR